jgi:hypothetical protein
MINATSMCQKLPDQANPARDWPVTAEQHTWHHHAHTVSAAAQHGYLYCIVESESSQHTALLL